MRTTRQLPETWKEGRLHVGGREYPTMNPPAKPRTNTKPRASRPVEADVSYGPFIIRCYYTQTKPFAPPRKLGYVLCHPDGWGWYHTIFATIPDARALGATFAHSLNGIGGSPVAVVDEAA